MQQYYNVAIQYISISLLLLHYKTLYFSVALPCTGYVACTCSMQIIFSRRYLNIGHNHSDICAQCTNSSVFKHTGHVEHMVRIEVVLWGVYSYWNSLVF